jgi:plastocyanin
VRIAAALLACALVLTGCGGSDEPSTTKKVASSQSPTSDTAEGVGLGITIENGKVTPQGERVNVPVGAKVTLEVTSDAGEELHVHSDPEHTFEVKAGETKTFSFTIDTPGQVAVEAHHLDVTIVQLVVKP